MMRQCLNGRDVFDAMWRQTFREFRLQESARRIRRSQMQEETSSTGVLPMKMKRVSR